MGFMVSLILTLIVGVGVVTAEAVDPARCAPKRDLITIPEIKSQNGRLKGTIVLGEETRLVPGKEGGAPCADPSLRYFHGFSAAEPTRPWPSTGDAIPGPTLRARVGDWVQLTFLNHVNPGLFSASADHGRHGTTEGCDRKTAQRTGTFAGPFLEIYPRNDTYPNCMHGSSTTNIHFHGTHTTPSTTGDNVLVFIRPAARQDGKLDPSDDFVKQQFEQIFANCERDGPPQRWDQLPEEWRKKQQKLLEDYDAQVSLPPELRLSKKNEQRLKDGLWPQYSVGAYPYCFPLPAHDPAKLKMGQAPGTHWYHAHKHGSTALNVANGMTGAFVIEGDYDDALRRFYRDTPERKNWGLQEHVLVIQQLQSGLNLFSGGDPGKGRPPLSVNGRLNPVVRMRPNQVQLWRIVNGSPRTFVQFADLSQGRRSGKVTWRQIAQDGVQFTWKNYEKVGTINTRFALATANRADLLVRAPAQPGPYAIKVVQTVRDIPGDKDKDGRDEGTIVDLLTVQVVADDKKIDPPMDFIAQPEDFPKFPEFLGDITERIATRRELTFDTKPVAGRNAVGLNFLSPEDQEAGRAKMPRHDINGQQFHEFNDDVDQVIPVDAVEEWTLYNRTPDIAHSFHIHINPFQVVEVFQPNSPGAKDTNDPECYADPLKPSSWKPCKRLAPSYATPPYVWWDVFAIPTARQDTIAVCAELAACPEEIKPYTTCAKGACKVTIPGYFKMRSRFVDFTGQYVFHCHILAHEDRGMMQLVEVIPRRRSPDHH
jgi:FtsP/CotA-like multicopper oxidase with cupredoxin domain